MRLDNTIPRVSAPCSAIDTTGPPAKPIETSGCSASIRATSSSSECMSR
jgi:hypothetical protein